MTTQRTCPDCGQEMELGFIPDATYAGGFCQTCWHRGTPRDRTFLGLKVPFGSGNDLMLVKHDPEVMMPVTTFRCTGCGVLRSYAVEEE